MSCDFSLGEIAAFLDVEVRGDAERRITGLSTLQNSEEGHLTFLSNPKYLKFLSSCKASAVILSSKNASNYDGTCLITDDPYLAYARISEWFDVAPFKQPGIHSSAIIDPTASLATEIYIGPNVVVDENVKLDPGCYVEANCFIGARSSIGKNGYLAANVCIYHDVKIGHSTRIHSGAVIGADGFGIAPRADKSWQKIHQIGGVTIGDNVEVGACSTIDRGAIENTELGDGVKLDNHVQIAHNACVGDNTVMAAYSGLAGSAKVGKNCILAGDVCIVGHVDVCDDVQLTARTLVTKSITESGSYSSGSTPLMTTVEWRKNSVRIGQLDKLARQIKKSLD
ncbi:MAG: UDP-3-O-(3-hydroxymyristoyl)glucosamine N-acyltransferase [Porticoccaceae bacterium]|nr:UDP-3-O-(3-hydroxymyristoyl)glucosamine N-acyltransferase [Porticoccaceae bacterium]